MKKSTQYILARITPFGIGAWLFIGLTTSKTINFLSNRTETIFGALTALGIILFSTWIANYNQKIKIKKDNSSV